MHCTVCGLHIAENDAFVRAGVIYCCEGCANHTGCTCYSEETAGGLQKIA